MIQQEYWIQVKENGIWQAYLRLPAQTTQESAIERAKDCEARWKVNCPDIHFRAVLTIGEPISIALNIHEEWYYGRHEQHSPEEGPSYYVKDPAKTKFAKAIQLQ